MVPGMTPRLYNSLGREFAEVVPAVPGHVGMYTCGLTVYADPHLGNMRPYVFSDVLRRMLEWKGLDVTQVVNITDVGHTVGESDLGDDKVEAAARSQNATVAEITQHYTDVFFEDLAALGVLPHTHNPKASDYVEPMIEFARELERKGYTYQLDSGLYFVTAKSANYGRLALRHLEGEDAESVARLEAVPGKRSPADFAVWRSERGDRQRLVHWDSPWGPGVPGWHLECSVMSMQLLGAHFDIHTGGVDHREIHHVNEIAQSEAYLDDGADWVRLWMHNEFMLLANQKIAKSAGRMPLLRDLTAAGYHPMAFRYFLLTAHYRSQLDLTDAGLRGAAAALRRLLGRVAPLRPLRPVRGFEEAAALLKGPAARAALERIDQAISDDLNTARVIAEFGGVLRDEEITDEERAVLASVTDWLTGLDLGRLDPDRIMVGDRSALPTDYIEELLVRRDEARAARDWATADRVRDQLTELGVRVVDTPEGSHWEPIPLAEAEAD